MTPDPSLEPRLREALAEALAELRYGHRSHAGDRREGCAQCALITKVAALSSPIPDPPQDWIPAACELAGAPEMEPVARELVERMKAGKGIEAETQHWAVTVERNGENVVTIESNCLSGRDLSDEDARVIRLCGEHLLSFVGRNGLPDPPQDEETLTWPRVINDDGTLRLEQTSPPNSYLRVVRNSDNVEVVSTPCVTTEPKDEIIRLLTGAWIKALRSRQSPPVSQEGRLSQAVPKGGRTDGAVFEQPDGERPSGSTDDGLYCYGGCGRRYEDFGLDNSLPNRLWNLIAPNPGTDREGGGGVLCANCVVERLSKLPNACIVRMTLGLTDGTEPWPLTPDNRPSPPVERTKENPVEMVKRLDTDIPRRNCADLWTDAEKAIQDALDAVERAGAHPLLTDAVVLLGKARDAVADFVELPSTQAPPPEDR